MLKGNPFVLQIIIPLIYLLMFGFSYIGFVSFFLYFHPGTIGPNSAGDELLL